VSVPRVSVVVPFYNTQAFIGECIESVLAQTFVDFELLLVNNHSTDGSREVAERYLARDPRVRLIDNEVFLGQVDNYNNALRLAAPDVAFIKIVQADDWIFPDCLRLMVKAGVENPGAGIISSYYLHGTVVFGAGLPVERTLFTGREVARAQLMGRGFFVGSPTTVMYRADLVRARHDFYARDRLHEDTEVVYDILLEHDFAFVPQILSYLRTDDASIMGRRQSFNPTDLDGLLCLHRYGPRFLEPEEFRQRHDEIRFMHCRFLGRSLVTMRGCELWQYHRKGLATEGLKLPWFGIVTHAVNYVLDFLLNPKRLVEALGRGFRRRWRKLR